MATPNKIKLTQCVIVPLSASAAGMAGYAVSECRCTNFLLPTKVQSSQWTNFAVTRKTTNVYFTDIIFISELHRADTLETLRKL